MYCVNLLDIFLPPNFRRSSVCQNPGATQHASNVSAFAPIFPLWNERPPTSVGSSTAGQLSVATAAGCIKNRYTNARERHERHRQSSGLAGREAERETW